MYHKKTYLLDLQRIRAGSNRDISSGILLDRNERSVPYDGELTRLLLEKLAKIKNLDVNYLDKITTNNFNKLFFNEI